MHAVARSSVVNARSVSFGVWMPGMPLVASRDSCGNCLIIAPTGTANTSAVEGARLKERFLPVRRELKL
jgi:hypothetical protein